MDEKEGKQKITSPKRLRGPTLKPEIAKKRSEGLKIDIQYNDDGEGVGEGYVQLVSYMGVLARTMVPVYHTDWRVVPVELKEKLWDCVKGAFLVDENSKNNVISSIGTSFRSFRHRLTKEYILPYKDKPEYLLQPPTEYNYIPIEDWRKLVANRLSKEFQVKSKKGKERRAKYVYIHRVSRKGYAGLQEELMQKTGSRKPIDRWVLWKLARLKKGEYDEVTRPVVEKIDELTKAVEEGKITCVGQKDILTLALGTLEHPGREECQRMLMEKVKSLEEEIIALKAGKKEPLTPRSEVSSTNIRKQLLQHEEIGGKTHDSAHVENLSAQGTRKASPLTQVYKCKLALETEDNIVAYGTYLRDSQISIDGADILVVILYPLQPNALLPFPLSENIRTIREGVGYEVLWPIAFVINDDDEVNNVIPKLSKMLARGKNKMKKIQASPKKIKYENPRDVQLFSKTVSAMLEGKPAPKVDFPINVFGMKFQTFLLTSEMNDVISAKELTMNCICFYNLVRFCCKSLCYIHDINKGFRIFVSQKKKGSKKELKWMVVEGPKQLDGVMCGYFVMRYMRDIIANRSLLTSQVYLPMFRVTFAVVCNFEMTRSYVHRNVIQHKGKCHSSSPLKWCSPWKESSSHQLVFGLPMP
ncbi:hypothetical protein CK203_116016 [Vitis vinifera]|uniref:Ubiquitin-like protease family profile domain-containing protein n=1 Tax=Vitis vinifera TaxID=29760 RepID=A0A438FF55_VITVI|nr:hypothetical protein CK203_116016 [Vitis vinifera]